MDTANIINFKLRYYNYIFIIYSYDSVPSFFTTRNISEMYVKIEYITYIFSYLIFSNTYAEYKTVYTERTSFLPVFLRRVQSRGRRFPLVEWNSRTDSVSSAKPSGVFKWLRISFCPELFLVEACLLYTIFHTSYMIVSGNLRLQPCWGMVGRALCSISLGRQEMGV